MKMALNAAWQYQGLTYPNPAVGCTIVQNGTVIAVGAHAKAGAPHAEIMALKEAYMALSMDKEIETLTSSHEIHEYLLKHHKNIFSSCDIYVTLEPCSHEGKTPSCANLLQTMHPQNIYISHYDPNPEARGGAQALISAGVDVHYGLCEEEGKDLLSPFIKWNKENFILFKWAQRLDGTIDGGLVSDKASRLKVHALRNKCDLIVIGGNTVREDRPSLDARFVDGKAPDVLIYSRCKNFTEETSTSQTATACFTKETSQTCFDKEIPLFDIKDRNVFIEDSFEKLKDYKNILIEGGPAMFEATKDIVDRYLCFLAPKTGGRVKFSNGNENFKILQSDKLDNDIMLWMER